MNTRQLTALWYTVLLFTAFAVLDGFSTGRDSSAFAGVAAAIIILGLTLLYTLSDNPKADPKRLWKTVALPLACIVAIAGTVFIAYQVRMGMQQSASLKADKQQSASVKPVEIVDRELPPNDVEKLQADAKITEGNLSCIVYNGSTWAVKEIIVHVDIAGTSGTVGRLVPDATANPAMSPSKVLTFDDLGNVIPAGTLDLEPANAPRQPISRDFRLTGESHLIPLGTAYFTSFIGIKVNPNEKCSWKIISARGHPE